MNRPHPADADADAERAALIAVLRHVPDLEFAVLVGSRAQGRAQPHSDWDVAIRWQRGLTPWQRLEATESLRLQLAQCLRVGPEAIDLIDLAQARLAMRALVAEQGLVLAGDQGLPWLRFLQTTWAEIEEFHWRQQHAA
ncbi:MAG: nucleotidyltransferase domain-containing protein [Serpentinimonas sp.]|nr:nucleotidyltransferase domain-containing protein [Serpentinimonas sp.]